MSNIESDKILLISIAIGENYNNLYTHIFKRSQELYAKKCNYDFLVLKNFIDQTYACKETISFNKILTCTQKWSQKYKFVIFIDADIFINENAPPIHLYTNFEDKIGIVDEFSQPTYEKRIELQRKNGWETSAIEHYKLCNFDLETTLVLNSGVLVMQPKYHAELCSEIYNKYIKQSITSPRGYIYEQAAIGYELQKQNKYILLPHKFNALWSLEHLSNPTANLLEFYNSNYFIHFAGGQYKAAAELNNLLFSKKS